MSDSTKHSRVGFMLEILGRIARESDVPMAMVLVRTADGKWKAMFDDQDFRGMRAAAQQGIVGGHDDIEKALMSLIARPRS